MNTLLEWIHANQNPAFIGGIFLLIALGMLLKFTYRVIKQAVYAVRGIPPEITVSCCCSCHDDHEDEDEDGHA